METTSTKTLELDFLTKNGESMNLSLPDYLDNLTQEQIEASAQTIVDQNIFQPQAWGWKSWPGTSMWTKPCARWNYKTAEAR